MPQDESSRCERQIQFRVTHTGIQLSPFIRILIYNNNSNSTTEVHLYYNSQWNTLLAPISGILLFAWKRMEKFQDYSTFHSSMQADFLGTLLRSRDLGRANGGKGEAHFLLIFLFSCFDSVWHEQSVDSGNNHSVRLVFWSLPRWMHQNMQNMAFHVVLPWLVHWKMKVNAGSGKMTIQPQCSVPRYSHLHQEAHCAMWPWRTHLSLHKLEKVCQITAWVLSRQVWQPALLSFLHMFIFNGYCTEILLKLAHCNALI